VDRFLARHEVPIIEGARCTFLYRGDASEVHLVHQIFGLPRRIPLRRLRGTDLWYVVLELPDGSRVEYQLEVAHGEQRERINDPLNPHVANSPLGSSSVCYARGHEVPEWTRPDPESRPGSLAELVIPSRALRRSCRVTLYLPARFRRNARYPLLIVHDGGDYLRYAAAQTVLDNLIHRLDVAETIAAFVYPGERLAEYGNSAAHARYLTAELVPRLEEEFPLAATPSARCLMGASFGAVGALSTAYRYPGVYGSLLLQSGSFVFTGIGSDHIVTVEPFAGLGYKRRNLELIGITSFGFPTNTRAGDDEGKEFAFGFASLYKVTPHIQPLLEWDGHHILSGPSRGETVVNVSPGIKLLPDEHHWQIGLGAGFPLTHAKEFKLRAIFSVFYHF